MNKIRKKCGKNKSIKTKTAHIIIQRKILSSYKFPKIHGLGSHPGSGLRKKLCPQRHSFLILPIRFPEPLCKEVLDILLKRSHTKTPWRMKHHVERGHMEPTISVLIPYIWGRLFQTFKPKSAICWMQLHELHRQHMEQRWAAFLEPCANSWFITLWAIKWLLF